MPSFDPLRRLHWACWRGDPARPLLLTFPGTAWTVFGLPRFGPLHRRTDELQFRYGTLGSFDPPQERALFPQVVRHLLAVRTGPIVLFGHSQGACRGLALVTSLPAELRARFRLVLAAPAGDVRGAYELLAGEEVDWMEETWRAAEPAALGEPGLLARTWLVSSAEDEVVRPEGYAALAGALGSRHVELCGVGHVGLASSRRVRGLLGKVLEGAGG